MHSSHFEFRKANKADDICKIAEYLHLTDAYIYPTICENPCDTAWQEYVAGCMNTPHHIFQWEHLSVATCDGQIIGVACVVPCATALTATSAKGVPVSLKDGMDKAMQGYFLPLIDESMGFDGVNVVNVCVDAAFRGRGIGGRLMQHCVELYGDQTMHLDVVADNTAARQLYERVGFAIDHEYDGFSGNDEPLRCYHMIRHPGKKER